MVKYYKIGESLIQSSGNVGEEYEITEEQYNEELAKVQALLAEQEGERKKQEIAELKARLAALELEVANEDSE